MVARFVREPQATVRAEGPRSIAHGRASIEAPACISAKGTTAYQLRPKA